MGFYTVTFSLPFHHIWDSSFLFLMYAAARFTFQLNPAYCDNCASVCLSLCRVKSWQGVSYASFLSLASVSHVWGLCSGGNEWISCWNWRRVGPTVCCGLFLDSAWRLNVQEFCRCWCQKWIKLWPQICASPFKSCSHTHTLIQTHTLWTAEVSVAHLPCVSSVPTDMLQSMSAFLWLIWGTPAFQTFF